MHTVVCTEQVQRSWLSVAGQWQRAVYIVVAKEAVFEQLFVLVVSRRALLLGHVPWLFIVLAV